MEVNLSNYLEVLPEVCRKLETASFVCFDAEYSGLKGSEGVASSLFDNIEERYEKLRNVVINNSAPQFGLAIFQRNSTEGEETAQLYSVDAYFFYLSEPCFYDFNMTKTKASVEIDCCQFLNSIRFDFEQWIQNAAPYLNNDRLKELQEYLEKNPDLILQCQLNDRPLPKAFFPEERTTKLTKDVKEDLIRKLRGFSVIVDVISEKKIPLVGHNMVLDLMYFFNQFCEDLPEKYDDFKKRVTSILPAIYDTKYMTVRCRKLLDHPSNPQHSIDDKAVLNCSGLYVIYKTSSTVTDKFSPSVLMGDTCKYFEKDLKLGRQDDLEELEVSTLCHQPSFDACVTGIVFLNLAHIACRISRNLLLRKVAPSLEEVFAEIRHFQDQLFVARATIMTMVLKGYDPRPNRTWVKVTSPSGATITERQVMELVKANPELERQMAGVDIIETGESVIILAVARQHSAKEIAILLRKKGFDACKILIPWDKKRFDKVSLSKIDNAYDTRRNKLFN